MAHFRSESESFIAYFYIALDEGVATEYPIIKNTNFVFFLRNNTKLVKKTLFSCEIGNLSGKDDQIGKKNAVFLRNRYSF